MYKFILKDHLHLKPGSWSKKTNFSCFFIWSIERVEKTDFIQLVTKLSNETENPL